MKTKVGIIYGGKSAEHEVSLQSARNIIDAINKDKYEVVEILIGKNGQWSVDISSLPKLIDVAFPVLHGPFGEDGTVQGLLKLLNVPFVGPGVLGSAVGMDKDVMKRLFDQAGIPTAKCMVLSANTTYDLQKIFETLGTPVFIKPANLGSSVGVNRATNLEELDKAIKEAFQFDNKILIEEAIVGEEVECSVMGNEQPIASLLGKIIPKDGFYSYEAKYIDENGAALEIPAKVPEEVANKAKQIAVTAFKVLCLEGMARVDMFVRNGEVVVNEVNTIPGFTTISMYPKLWEASGLRYPDLIDKLIELGLQRHARENKLRTSYN